MSSWRSETPINCLEPHSGCPPPYSSHRTDWPPLRKQTVPPCLDRTLLWAQIRSPQDELSAAKLIGKLVLQAAERGGRFRLVLQRHELHQDPPDATGAGLSTDAGSVFTPAGAVDGGSWNALSRLDGPCAGNRTPVPMSWARALREPAALPRCLRRYVFQRNTFFLLGINLFSALNPHRGELRPCE